MICEHCSKSFRDQNALWQHVRVKHRGKKHAHLKPVPEREESIAEAMVYAAENPTDENYAWARDMWRDQ